MREALDGTDTQVATYAIDRWTAKMKGAEEYITREISRIVESNSEDTESSIGEVSEEEKKNSSSNEAQGRTLTIPPTTLLAILLPNDPARSLTKSSQRHIYSERHPLNRDPTIGTVYGKNLCASENDNRTRQGQTPKREQ